jgi:hypothetical protein
LDEDTVVDGKLDEGGVTVIVLDEGDVGAIVVDEGDVGTIVLDEGDVGAIVLEEDAVTAGALGEELGEGYVAAGTGPAGGTLIRLGDGPARELVGGVPDELAWPGGVNKVTLSVLAGVTALTAGTAVIDPSGVEIVEELDENAGAVVPPNGPGIVFAGRLVGGLVSCVAGGLRPGICTVGGLGNAVALTGADSSGFCHSDTYIPYPTAANTPMTIMVFSEFMFVLLDEPL